MKHLPPWESPETIRSAAASRSAYASQCDATASIAPSPVVALPKPRPIAKQLPLS
jgi:hypothetical protein